MRRGKLTGESERVQIKDPCWQQYINEEHALAKAARRRPAPWAEIEVWVPVVRVLVLTGHPTDVDEFIERVRGDEKAKGIQILEAEDRDQL